MSSAQSALRYVAAAKTSSRGTLHLRCYVKPGAAKAREGVTGLTEDAIEICVAAQPRQGEANKAVLRLLSEILGVPRSDFQVIQGANSRHKTVALSGVADGEEGRSFTCQLHHESRRKVQAPHESWSLKYHLCKVLCGILHCNDLLDKTTLELETFISDIPPYAKLSHTSGDDDFLFEHLQPTGPLFGPGLAVRNANAFLHGRRPGQVYMRSKRTVAMARWSVQG
ncbi:UPF0235 protein like [Verticillium longisporum]|nr:UPF0235 protein like [Verticillium longisporum]